MSKARRRLLGGTLLLIFGLITGVSLYSLRPDRLPDMAFPLFLPGYSIAVALQGGIHGVGEEAVWLNILFWALTLGVPGIYCFLTERSTPGDLPPIGGAG